MLTLRDSASCDEITAAACDDVVRNRVVSPCGRYVSFDLDGHHFDLDWEDPTGIPHEQAMEELRLYCEELERQP